MKDVLKDNGIPIIDSKTNYWFVRTRGGDYFGDYYFGNYIAIEWDELNDLEFIKTNSHVRIKNEVSYKYPEESRPGLIASQIIEFVNVMKAGDYVLIPSENSDYIAFGIILDKDAHVYEPTKQEILSAQLEGRVIDVLKRRKVEWLKHVKKEDLDPYLYRIIYSHNTIVDLNPYSAFIDRTLFDIFYKDEALHAVFEVNNIDDIAAFDLMEFINNTIGYLEAYAGEKIIRSDLSIKATINSPGPIEFIAYGATAAVALGALGLFISGGKFNIKTGVNILNQSSETQIEAESDGIIERIRQFRESDTENKLKLAEEKVIESKDKLNIESKKEPK